MYNKFKKLMKIEKNVEIQEEQGTSLKEKNVLTTGMSER